MTFAIVSIGCYLKDIEEIINNTSIEIVGRYFAYPEAIDEFLEKYSNIEMIIISEDFYNHYKDEIIKKSENEKVKRYIVLTEKKQIDEEGKGVEIYDLSYFLREQKNIYLMELKKEEMDMSKLGIENSNLVVMTL